MMDELNSEMPERVRVSKKPFEDCMSCSEFHRSKSKNMVCGALIYFRSPCFVRALNIKRADEELAKTCGKM